MSDLRPSGGYEDGAARLLASARARAAAIAADLAVPPRLRLTERQRRAVAALFAALVREVEDALRAAFLERLPADAPETLRAALGSAALPIALPLLEVSAFFADAQLLPLLLRRAEEHRLAAAGSDHGLPAALAGDEDAAVAAEAMGLLIGLNSRFDSFQEPLIGRSDLPADLRHRLVWTVAAALRTYVVAHHRLDPAAVDAAIAAAAAATTRGYDEAEGVEARAMRLAGLLAARGRLDDQVAAQAVEEGNLALLLAALAVRSGFGFEAAWDLLGDPVGAPLLLRAAGIERAAAAAILLRLGPDDAEAAARIDRFDTLNPHEVARLLAPWRADPAYRAAIAELAA
ncbi:MAG: DUF2336 domain-containing protein [Alphaproteobacteria bacterium]|nr:DUF2336 domain-containing protein [Alphaproteobacteria bacterium]